YWDPELKRYELARAPLGVVKVTPAAGAAAAASAEAAQPILPGLPDPRGALAGRREARTHADDSALFWIGGLAAPPLVFAFAVVGRRIGRPRRRAWRGPRARPGGRPEK